MIQRLAVSLALLITAAAHAASVNEFAIVVPASSSGVYGVILNPENRLQGYDVTTNDGATYLTLDRTDSDQQISFGSAISVGGSQELQVASLPSGLSEDQEHYMLVFNDSDNLIGTITYSPQYGLVDSVVASEVTGGINTDAGTITTLDGLDTAQDTQHGTTRSTLSTILGTPVDDLAEDIAAVLTSANSAATAANNVLTALGTNGDGLSNLPYNSAWDAEIQSEVTDAFAAYDPPTNAEVEALIAGLNDVSASEVNSEVDTALAELHLDHLLAVEYDPASKPGVATALLNEIFESDSGVSRFTANALEQAPSGGGGGGDATAANQTSILNAIAALNDFDPASDSVDLGSILGTSLTESAGGQVAGAFSYWYDVATPAKTINDAGVSGSGLTAADVWAYSGGSGRTLSGTIATLDALDTAQDSQHAATLAALAALNDISEAEVNAQVDAALADASLATAAALATAQADLDTLTGADGVTLATLQPNYAPATAAALAALNNLSAADVNAQVDAAIADAALGTAANQSSILAILGTPSDLGNGDTLANNLSDLAGATFNLATDSNEAIRNRGDSAWTGGGGGSAGTLTAEAVADARTWTLTPRAGGYRAQNIVTVTKGYEGPLQLDFATALNARTGVESVTSVASSPAIAFTDERVSGDRERVIFDAPELTTAGEYTLTVTVATTDTTALPILCTLRVVEE